MNSRQIATKGVGKSSRIFAMNGLVFANAQEAPATIFKGPGVLNARMPSYLITPAGGRFKRKYVV